MPKIEEENLPFGTSPKYDCAENAVITYINKARQVAKLGPGLKEFEVPLIPSLSKGEINRFVGEIHKTLPLATVHIANAGAEGVAIYAAMLDPTFKKPEPTKVDLSTVGGDAHHKRLWQVCREQADYVAGRDTDNHEKPDCSSGCRYFFPLEGKLGMDWGVCTEPRSPRAGLLTFEHMGCSFFEAVPEDDGETPPAGRTKKASANKKSGVT